ncbi:NlpC/P60 family protein [Nocardia sp. CNY236]|uniref:NlpC/P60 family protein n=1 Tax=Nocardia sp. CNY236 TaxID=1169152 RepID=UPI00048E0BE5|nr:NlpC/P60 family protein [Nocardia sp. CNY236]
MRNSGELADKNSRLIAVGLLYLSVVLLSAGSVAAVPPPPPNPSDSRIAAAAAQVDAAVAEVGGLINRVAEVGQQLRRLDEAFAQRREAVNKALVDLQVARDAADVAAAEVVATQRASADAVLRVGAARDDFDRFAAQVYTRPSAGSLVGYLTVATPGQMVDRAQLLGVVAEDRKQVLEGLRRAHIEAANTNASARRAKSTADAAAAAATARKLHAEQAAAAAAARFHQYSAQRDELVHTRHDAQRRLDQARRHVAGLRDQRSAFEAWDAQRAAEEEALRVAAAAAAARSTADHAAHDRAAAVGTGKRPHTQFEDAPRPGLSLPRSKPPAVRGAAAIEVVVDRALSQLGVTYAWGGGDEVGPTLGIRDGGVADRHGDYAKTGFDCSGLMVYAFAGIGVALPHYSGYQYTAGARVPVADRERGDMLFWGPNGSRHVALYLGDGTMVEAPQSGDVVKVSPVREDGIMPYAVRMVP